MKFIRKLMDVGSSKAVSIPTDIVKHLNMKSGDKVKVSLNRNKITIEPYTEETISTDTSNAPSNNQ